MSDEDQNQRITLRMNQYAYNLLQIALPLSGCKSLSEFICLAAEEKAEKVIAQHERLKQLLQEGLDSGESDRSLEDIAAEAKKAYAEQQTQQNK